MTANRLVPALLALALAAPTALAAQARLPRVTVIATGGTIAGRSTGPTRFQSYRSGQVPIGEMIDVLRPQIDSVAEVVTVQFGNRASGAYTIADYRELTLAIDRALESSDGVVVTTGTDTQEEFVYWADLTVRSQKPVVFTGSMRPWTVIGSDAQANLFNSIVLAASGETRCFGAVNLLNDEFHAAKEVWKSDGSRLNTFIDRKVGILGYVDELEVRTFRAPPRVLDCDDPARWRTPFDLSRLPAGVELPRVEVLMGYQGAVLDEAVAAMADAGVDGIVVAGGGVSREARAAAQEKGVFFASTQRFRSGDDNLMPQKARLLLLLALAFTDDPEQVDRWMEEIAGREFDMSRRGTGPTTRP